MVEFLYQLLLVLVVFACLDTNFNFKALSELILEMLRRSKALEDSSSHHDSHLSG